MRGATEKTLILEKWAETLAARPDAPAILSPDGTRLRTFAEIEAESRDLAKKLPRDARLAALDLDRSPAWPATLLACWRAGLLLPLPGLEPDRARDTATRLGASLLLRPNSIELLPSSSTDLPSGVALLKLTSGTTCQPRAIAFSAAQLLADCNAVCDAMDLRPTDINLGAIPPAHSYGFSNLLTPLLCRGIPFVPLADRLPRPLLAACQRSGVTVFPGTPALFSALADLGEKPGSLRRCISAGSPLPAPLAECFTSVTGLRIQAFYGSSECGGIAFDDATAGPYADGFVGHPMPGVRIEPLHDGRIAIHGPAVGLGYFPEPDRDTLADGRFIPGDLVEISPAGLTLRGRASDLINVDGRKVNPAEIEAILARADNVRRVAVFGLPSARRGEEPVACVEGDVTPENLARFAREHLEPWRIPRDFWIVAKLPTDDRGKTSRHALREAYRCSRGQ